MRLAVYIIFLLTIICLFSACNNNDTSVKLGSEFSSLNATSPFLLATVETNEPVTSNGTAQANYPRETPIILPEINEPVRDFKIVGYITHWHLNRLYGMNIDGLTHLIWQGVEITDSGNPALHVSNNADWRQISDVVEIGHAANVKVLVSLIGHWEESSLNNIWKSPELRKQLILNLKELLVLYDLDGIDIDNENKACEKTVYSSFIKELYDELNPLGKIITVAGNPYRVCLNPSVYDCVAFINMMTYDMGNGVGYPYHSTLEESIKAIDIWVGSGMPKDKLLMGIPLYGRDGHVTFFEYWWIVDRYSPASRQNQVDDPTVAGGIIWWNGLDLAKEKTRYVFENDYGGIMLYELGTDSTDNYSILQSVLAALEQSIHEAVISKYD